MGFGLGQLVAESTDADVLIAFARALVGLDRTDEAGSVLASLEAMGYASPELIALGEAVRLSAS